MIYLNCAATSFKRPACVGEAVLAAMSGLGSYGRGAGDEDLDAARTIYRTREKLAALLGFSHPERVCFTSGATQALNTAIMGLSRTHGRVIATVWEHNASLRPLARLEDEQGVRVGYVPTLRNKALNMEVLEALLEEPADFLVCTHASNVTGMVTDVAAIAALAHARGVPVVLDAAQTAGSLPFSMEELGVDVLSVTGHKGLMGPTGTGAILVAPGVEIAPLIEGGTGVRSAERRQPAAWPEHLEAGTLNMHGIAGLEAALDWLGATGIEAVHEHEARLLRRFIDGIEDDSFISTYGSFAGEHCGIVSVNVGDLDSFRTATLLSEDYGIAVRSGLHCAPRMHRALRTLGRGTVRFSFNWFTTSDEIDAAVAALREIAEDAI